MAETGDTTLGYARPFFIRFGGHSYDIGDGAPVKFVDMTRDGSQAYFTSSEKLTADDHDNSVDLYLWQDSDPTELTRVSKGATGNDGDRDNCNLGWVENCDVQMLTDAIRKLESQRERNRQRDHGLAGRGHQRRHLLHLPRAARRRQGQLRRSQRLPLRATATFASSPRSDRSLEAA